jgi:hypothetical protein
MVQDLSYPLTGLFFNGLEDLFPSFSYSVTHRSLIVICKVTRCATKTIVRQAGRTARVQHCDG